MTRSPACRPLVVRSRAKLAGLASVILGIQATVAVTANASFVPFKTGDTYVLSSTGWQVGQSSTVSTVGPAGSPYWLMFDVVPGHFDLPSGDTIELGLTPYFYILDRSTLANGRRDWSAQLPNDPALIGWQFYLQALALEPSSGQLRTSNTLFETVKGGGGAVIERPYPTEGAAVPPSSDFEVWALGSLDPNTVNSSTVTLRDLSRSVDVPCDVSLKTSSKRAAVIVRPRTALWRGSNLRLELGAAVKGGDGSDLVGQKQFSWSVLDRSHPFLFTNRDELALNRSRAESGVSPWKEGYDYHREDVTNGLKHNPSPHKGGPPKGWNDFYNMYVDWFTDMKYAQALAKEWALYGDPTHGDKAVKILTAWLVFDPAVVGEWYWSIQYDIAGLSMLECADSIWEYSGLSDDQRSKLRAFFQDLGGVVKTYQLDAKDANPGNIRSWNNTMMAGIGYFLGDLDLVDFTLDGSRNPFSHGWMLDNAMEDSGRMYDWVREKEDPVKGITYPVYHLQAWSMFSECHLHNGRDVYLWRNVRGHDLSHGWEYYIPYMRGDKKVSGYTEDYRRVDISKSYLMQRIFRRSDIDDLYGKYGGEPYFEVHIFKKTSSFTHAIPSSLLGSDKKAPTAPRDPWTQALGATFLSFVWNPSVAADEGDMVRAYNVYRDGALVGSTAETRFVDEGLAPARGYDYKIRAVDYVGNEGPEVGLHLWTRDLEN